MNTFNLNAATLVDLLSIPGVSRSLADDILKHSPYSSLNDLSRVPGFPPALLSRFTTTSEVMTKILSGSAVVDDGLNLSIILWSYGRRALILLALASLAGALLYARVRSVGRFRAALAGLVVSSLVMGLARVTNGTRAPIAYSGAVILLGVPATLYYLGRHHLSTDAARVLLAWAMAAIPAILLAYPWI